MAVGVFFAEKDAEEAFRIGRGHSQDSGDPAPENSARTAQGDGRGNPYDISRSQGGGKGGGKGGKHGEIPSIFLAFRCHGQADRFQNFFLRNVKFYGKIEMSSHEKKKQGTAPEKFVYTFHAGKKGSHGFVFPLGGTACY